MRIKAKTMMACAEWSAFPGQVIDLPREQAQPMVDAGYAEVVPTSTVRTAEAPAPQRQAIAPEPEAPEDKTKHRKGGRRR